MTVVPIDPTRVLCGVIGDVHGDLPALGAATDAVRAEAARRGLAPCVVWIGDLVDRGPDSADCAAFVMRLARGEDPERREVRTLFVRGDHDEGLSYDAVTDRFASSVEPADWAERLNGLPANDPERAVARDYVEFVRTQPAAILLRGEGEGILLAHGGVPHADLLPSLERLSDLDSSPCDRDFVWCRVASARRKIPNRASLLCDVGTEDVADAMERIAALVADARSAGFREGTEQTAGGEVVQGSPFVVRHFIHGHEHLAPGCDTRSLRGGARIWTVTTFRDDGDGFLPPIRPMVLLISSHAETAEGKSHAESAEFAEFVVSEACVRPAESGGCRATEPGGGPDA